MRLLERAVAKVDGDHVLDDLTVGFPGRRDVLLARATDKILIDRNADPMRRHDNTKRTADNGHRRSTPTSPQATDAPETAGRARLPRRCAVRAPFRNPGGCPLAGAARES